MTPSKNYREIIGQLIFPSFCVHCGKLGAVLCERCHDQLQFCLPTDLTATLSQRLRTSETVRWDSVQAVLEYDDLISVLMQRFKYQGVSSYSKLFSFWLYQYLPLPEVEAITYVPLHARRLRERGYNQAQLLAQELAARLQRPCWDLLTQPAYRDKQSLNLDRIVRVSSTREIFVAKDHQPRGKILVVDDVVTTGATLNEAARVLKEAGWGQVHAVALAHRG